MKATKDTMILDTSSFLIFFSRMTGEPKQEDVSLKTNIRVNLCTHLKTATEQLILCDNDKWAFIFLKSANPGILTGADMHKNIHPHTHA